MCFSKMKIGRPLNVEFSQTKTNDELKTKLEQKVKSSIREFQSELCQCLGGFGSIFPPSTSPFGDVDFLTFHFMAVQM